MWKKRVSVVFVLNEGMQIRRIVLSCFRNSLLTPTFRFDELMVFFVNSIDLSEFIDELTSDFGRFSRYSNKLIAIVVVIDDTRTVLIFILNEHRYYILHFIDKKLIHIHLFHEWLKVMFICLQVVNSSFLSRRGQIKCIYSFIWRSWAEL